MSDEIPDSPMGMGNEQAQHDRPDHPAFWQLSEILLGSDAAVQDDPSQLVKILEKFMPVNVVAYVAAQRALTMASRVGVPNEREGSVIVPIVRIFGMMSGSWVDGFALGAAWQKKYGDKNDGD